MLTRALPLAGLISDGRIGGGLRSLQLHKGRGIRRYMTCGCGKQRRRDALNDARVDRVAQGFECSRWDFGKMYKVAHALQAGTFARRHITALPPDDRNLRRRHRDQ